MSGGDGISVGDPAPRFELLDTEGEPHSLDEEAGAVTVVLWTCNHCPYALAWHERIAAVAGEYAAGARFLAINSNDPERYPDDAPEAMRERVRSEGGWPFPYLHDPDQAVARAFGAQTTPDLFVLDEALVLRYRGAPDHDHQDPGAGAIWLRRAIEAVRIGESPEPAETEPVGCSIKWSPAG